MGTIRHLVDMLHMLGSPGDIVYVPYHRRPIGFPYHLQYTSYQNLCLNLLQTLPLRHHPLLSWLNVSYYNRRGYIYIHPTWIGYRVGIVLMRRDGLIYYRHALDCTAAQYTRALDVFYCRRN